ncbi:MAG: beta-ketoacyl synthase N-terminal-like domain-containing protein, partial [Pseudomonadota bacterium]
MDNKGVMQQALLQIRQLKADLAAAQQQTHEPIAIIGMGCRFPGGAGNPAQLWQLLATGQDAITAAPADRWGGNLSDIPPGGFLAGVDQFDPHFFGISPREAHTLDPQQRLLLEVSWEALEAAGVIPEADSATGIFVGIAENDYRLLLDRHPPAQQEHLLTGTSLDMAVGRLSYSLGVTGPSVAINTACSSSLVAVHQACASLRQHECDLALAGGVNLMLVPEGTLALNATGALAPDGRCKTFAATADGYARGEGCGMVVLKRLTQAQRDGDRIAAVIRGSAVNHDGRSSTLVAPRGVAQQQLIQQALQSARMTPADIDYVEAHGTGTALGDPVELDALSAVFWEREDPLAIGSLKTNIGHLEAAAGIAGLMKVVLMLQQQALPPHLHCATPTPQVDWDNLPLQVPTELQDWSGNLAGVSSFGMSGTNAHVILEKAPPVAAVSDEVERPTHLLTLSAPDRQALAELVQYYQDEGCAASTTLADACYTANTGRTPFAYRLALTAATWPQMQAALADCDVQQAGYVPAYQAAPKIACLFTGQGAQSVGMGQVLYQTQPTFRAALAHCDALLASSLPDSLLSVLYPAEPSAQLHQTAYTQPALFALEYALYQLWSAWGVQPSVLLGHSVGELVAACVAGVFSLEDGLKLIAARGRLMQALPADGAMVALMCTEEQAQAALADDVDTVAIAAVNGPRSVVISGPATRVDRIVARLWAEGIRSKSLQVSHAFHSPLMEPMLDAFRQVAQSITYHAPQIPLISNVTGQLADETISTPDYWVRHVRAAVRFADGVQAAYAQGVNCFLEVGPKPVLLGLARLADGPEDVSYLPSLRAGRDDWQVMLHSLGQLYTRGAAIDWSAFDQDYQRQKVILPTYPFQRERYWIATDHHQPAPQLSPLVDRLLRLPHQQQVVAETEWSFTRLPLLAEHQVAGQWVSPGACQLAMVLETVSQAYPQNAWQLAEVVLPQALVLAEATDRRTVQVVLQTPGEDGDGAPEFNLVSFVPDQTAADVATHVSGSLVPMVQESVSVDLSAWQAECATPVDVTQLMATFQVQQIQLGPQFCWLAEVWSGAESVLGHLCLPDEVDRSADYVLHPGLLDACLQLTAVWQLADPEAQTETLLPFALGALKLLQPIAGTEWWACAQRLDAEHWDIRLCDTQGQLLLQTDRFSVRALPPQALAERPVWQDWLYEITWQQQPRSADLPDDLPAMTEFSTARADTTGESPALRRTWLLLAGTDGLGDALAAILSQQGEQVILVHAGEIWQSLAPTDKGVGSTQTGQIRPDQAADYDRLLTDDGPTPDVVVFLWGLDAPEVSDTASLTRGLQSLCTATLHLVQALLRANLAQTALWLISREAQAVLPDDRVSGLTQSTLWGLGRTIELEHPELQCTCLDLPQVAADPSAWQAQAEALATELSAGMSVQAVGTEADLPERQLALRRGGRYAARLQACVAEPSVPAGPFRLDSHAYGDLTQLYFASATTRDLAADEVLIRVQATGLNFRDVLIALAAYPDPDAAMGSECAGEIVAVGAAVTDLAVGDAVLALADHSFSDHVIARS